MAWYWFVLAGVLWGLLVAKRRGLRIGRQRAQDLAIASGTRREKSRREGF